MIIILDNYKLFMRRGEYNKEDEDEKKEIIMKVWSYLEEKS